MSNKVTVATFKKLKMTGQKITMLTAYDYPTAKIVDQSGVDAILVGDSLGMVVLGYEDTTQVTMDDMLHHIKAVSRGVENALIVGDMPFLSYHLGIQTSVQNAGRIIQEGRAQAVKLEGGAEVADDIKAIVKAGIPVMGHIGLTPQSIHTLGGYFVQGKTTEQAKRLIEDAKVLEGSGAFAVVLECVPSELSELISSQLTIPTIGIGAGKGCDGQILVIHDILGLYQKKSPSFVKRYSEIGMEIKSAVEKYVQEVKGEVFPDSSHSFAIDSQVIKGLYGGNQNEDN